MKWNFRDHRGAGFRHIWKEFQLLCVMSFKWYLRHLFGLWLSSCHSLHLYQCSLSISVRLTKNCPKLRANLVTEMSERWPSSSCFWVHSLCQKLGCRGKHVREALPQRKTTSNVTALHCLLTPTVWSLLVNVSPKKKYKRELLSWCCSSDSSGFRPV